MSSIQGLQIEPPLGKGVGYGIIIGVGAAFALGMSLVSWALSRFFSEKQTSEMFMTAKHSVKTGLTASAVVSSWTIAATLLTSTTYGYLYGVSGPFWYGAGASIQILLFSVFAIELKRKAPNAHTFLEVARTRYGPVAHITLGCYSLFFQFFQSVNLLVGGSTLYQSLTGVNRDAACFLFPIGVVIYTIFGGIKATFITDWVHTVIIYVVMLASLFTIYTTSAQIGSSDTMWTLLRQAANLHPVEGNAKGQYLTMDSQEGGFIGLVFIGAGFAAAVDSQLSQKAIAADPASTLAGYLIGGSAWFTIPFCLASSFGLAAAAAEHLPSFPTYPKRMTDYEITTGMAMPYAALAVWGTGGAAAVLIMAFMAVTSAMSSETMATSALITHDVYQAYFKPQATGDQLLRCSRITIVVFAICVAAVAVGLNHAGFGVNFIVTAVGVVVDSAIVPMACTVMWKKQSLLAVVASPLICSAAAIAAWLSTAYTHYGAINLTTLNGNLPLVAGNMMSVCGPLLTTPLLTYIKPDNYDWEDLKRIKLSDDADKGVSGAAEHDRVVESGHLPTEAHDAAENTRLKRARNYALIASCVMTLCYLILWPIPMYGTGYVFSKGFFKGWIVVVFLWAFYAASTITILPLWEGRRSISEFAVFLWGWAMGRKPVTTLDGVTEAPTSEASPERDAMTEGQEKSEEKS